MEKVIHTLNDLSAAYGELIDRTGEKIPMIRLIITVDRQDVNGRENGITWPDLWLEPHTAIAMSEAIRTALAKHLPNHAQSLEAGLPDDRNKDFH